MKIGDMQFIIKDEFEQYGRPKKPVEYMEIINKKAMTTDIKTTRDINKAKKFTFLEAIEIIKDSYNFAMQSINN